MALAGRTAQHGQLREIWPPTALFQGQVDVESTKLNPNLDNYNRMGGQPNDSSMDIDGSTLVYI